MKLLTLKLMQFRPLSNDHYHIYFNTVCLISWTREEKTKLLSKEKHYNAHNANASIQLETWCITTFKCVRRKNLKYVLHSKLQKHEKDLWLCTISFFTSPSCTHTFSSQHDFSSYAIFEVLMRVTVKFAVLWDVTPWILVIIQGFL